uniref:Uncharacterized protein n=1 Tax=Arundo donax TaxID=35708 RepID=A0A0A8Z2S8_ARUDO
MSFLICKVNDFPYKASSLWLNSSEGK